MRAALGLIGLGVMGRALAHNIRERGFPVTAWDAAPEARLRVAGEGIEVEASLAGLVARLGRPRIVLLLVPAESLAQPGSAPTVPGISPGCCTTASNTPTCS